uniref:Uncharacterized protein n=1 Tax=uncultured prokaryote TaxID=198431 RepID=A0A0H5QJI8_9ZZZZ|nr:hypothetical protein [uncultured prokaryote]
MAWPRHFLYSFRGHFGSSSGATLDEWSCGIRVGRVADGFPDLIASQVLAADAAGDWKKFFGTSTIGIGSNTFFDYVRLYTIGTDGKAEGEIFEAEPEGGPTAGRDAPSLPLQCSTVVTFDTVTRSRPRYGRIFVPTTGNDVGGAGRMSTSVQGNLLTAATTLVNDLNNLPGADVGDDVRAHIVSVVSSVGEGGIKPVLRVRVGDVVDTMRSRRNSLTESYVSADITP